MYTFVFYLYSNEKEKKTLFVCKLTNIYIIYYHSLIFTKKKQRKTRLSYDGSIGIKFKECTLYLRTKHIFAYIHKQTKLM